MTTCESELWRVEAYQIRYIRRWTAKESPLGGWKYEKDFIGAAEFQACGVEDCEHQIRQLFPKANSARGYCRDCFGNWQIVWTGGI